MNQPVIPVGLCQCGCGGATRIATINSKCAGQVKGEPLKFLRGHNLRGSRHGENASRWAGGRSISPHGYVMIQTTEGRKYEHIMIAEEVLGRPLPQYAKGDGRNVVVHHIDSNKQNNARSNLLICTHSYHTALHHRLEQSDQWPEFPKVVRNDKRGIHERT